MVWCQFSLKYLYNRHVELLLSRNLSQIGACLLRHFGATQIYRTLKWNILKTKRDMSKPKKELINSYTSFLEDKKTFCCHCPFKNIFWPDFRTFRKICFFNVHTYSTPWIQRRKRHWGHVSESKLDLAECNKIHLRFTASNTLEVTLHQRGGTFFWVTRYYNLCDTKTLWC